jgi:hypothetical protein
MQIMFPLLTKMGFQPEGKPWHYPIGRDAAAFHINAFAVQSFIDRVLRCQSDDMVDPVATLHHQKGLKLIRERLDGDDEEAKISDATIGVVLKLASAAQFSGHAGIAQQHMRGLWEMTSLRGGLRVFQDNPKLLVEIWRYLKYKFPNELFVLMLRRCDLGIALLANSDPVFYRQPAEPLPDYPEQVILIYSQEDMQLVQDLNGYLAEVWLVMRKFCLLVDLGTQTVIQPAIIYGTMTAVMYRLLRMGFAAGTLNESSRLGLLAFTHHIFLQWQDMRLLCHPFSETYRNYLQVHALGDTIPPRISLWLLMIGAMSFFGVLDKVWLADYFRRQAERCGVKTWKDGQEILKSSMWISLLDDNPGKQVYDSLIETSGLVLWTN